MGTMARAFDNHLYELLPSYFRQFSHRVKLGELRRVVRVIDRTGTKPVSDRDRHVVCLQYLADLGEMRVQEVFLVMKRIHLAMIDPPLDTIPVRRVAVSSTCLRNKPAWIVK